jgi:hypothetical protein
VKSGCVAPFMYNCFACNVTGKLSLNYPLFQRSAFPRVLGKKYNGKILPKFLSASKTDLINKQKDIKESY